MKQRTFSSAHPLEPEMIHIPCGEFLMGSAPEKDPRACDDEQPQHVLYLADYYLARAAVTNAQYATFVTAARHAVPGHWQGGQPPSGKEDHPVVYVSWYDAVAYCRWLAEVTGKPYRLPGEAEWEKGARGDDGRVYPWGDRWDATRCNTRESGKGDTSAVGAYSRGSSPYGLLDAAGNVLEWTVSLWGKRWDEPMFGYPYDLADGRENLEAGRNVLRVLRGGSFLYDARQARCAFRSKRDAGYRYWDVGVRVAAF